MRNGIKNNNRIEVKNSVEDYIIEKYLKRGYTLIKDTTPIRNKYVLQSLKRFRSTYSQNRYSMANFFNIKPINNKTNINKLGNKLRLISLNVNKDKIENFSSLIDYIINLNIINDNSIICFQEITPHHIKIIQNHNIFNN